MLVVVIACGGGRSDESERATKMESHPVESDPHQRDWKKWRHVGSGAVARLEGSTTCAKFDGQPRDAKWDECSDNVRSELACKPANADLQCSCLEDGVEKWAFSVKNVELQDKAEATRVARTSCHASFEGF